MGTFRLLLALVVVVFHLDLESSRWERFEYFTFTSILNINATDAVNLFFFISGFVIALTFNKNYQDSNFIYRTSYFYLNRILRIYPLYFLALFIGFVDSFYLNIINLPKDNPFLREDVLRNILILFHEKGSFINPVSWTLDFELRWYFLVPLIFLIKKYWNKNKKINSYIVLIVFVYLLLELIYLYYAKNILLVGGFKNIFLLGEGIFYFIPGYLIFEFFNKIEIKVNNYHFLYGFFFILIALIFPKTPIFIFFLISIYFCFTINSSNKIDKIFGDLSYPVYILHMPIMLPIYLQVNKYLGVIKIEEIYIYYLVYVVTILIFFVICYFSLIFIDYPINKIRKKFKKII